MKNEITYTQINGINYPNLALPEQLEVNIGKYGQMRLDFLKKHRRGTFTTLLTEGTLSSHLSAIDQETCSQVEILTVELAKQRGIDENLKKTNPLLWVQEKNNCLVSAEEVVLREVIYLASPPFHIPKFYKLGIIIFDFYKKILYNIPKM